LCFAKGRRTESDDAIGSKDPGRGRERLESRERPLDGVGLQLSAQKDSGSETDHELFAMKHDFLTIRQVVDIESH
jgi:hypothetical protein